MNLPREAIEPRAQSLLEGVRTSISRETYSHLRFFGRGGGLQTHRHVPLRQGSYGRVISKVKHIVVFWIIINRSFYKSGGTIFQHDVWNLVY